MNRRRLMGAASGGGDYEYVDWIATPTDGSNGIRVPFDMDYGEKTIYIAVDGSFYKKQNGVALSFGAGNYAQYVSSFKFSYNKGSIQISHAAASNLMSQNRVVFSIGQSADGYALFGTPNSWQLTIASTAPANKFWQVGNGLNPRYSGGAKIWGAELHLGDDVIAYYPVFKKSVSKYGLLDSNGVFWGEQIVGGTPITGGYDE